MSLPSPSFRGARRQPVPASARDWVGPADAAPSLPLRVSPRADVELAAWASQHAAQITQWLDECGAVLFSGFDIGLDAFAAVARALAGTAVPYRERSSPRTELAPGVYTSTDHPPDQSIALHNESSYQDTFPARLVFCCLVPPQEGGQTPLADTRRVLTRIDPAVVSAFARRGVRYVRNYAPGLGLTWQEAFQDSDAQRVERYCRRHDISTVWGADRTLRTEQVRPAIAVHPRTGQRVWFNHAAFFHVSALEPALRDALLDQVGPDGLPTSCSFGDGTPIDSDTLAEIRAAYAAETVAQPWQRGDVLLVDNLLAAHGRAPFRGPRRVVVSMAGTLAHSELRPAGENSR